jgi:hypothetical protein
MREFIKKILREEVTFKMSNRLLFEDDINAVRVLPSSDGMINIIDITTQTVYRYKLVANIGKLKPRNLNVKKIDIKTGDITIEDPTNSEVYEEKLEPEVVANILKNYKNKYDIDSVTEFKEKGFNVVIDLVFYETQQALRQ